MLNTQQHYSHFIRYLVWFEVLLINLELTHPGATDLIKIGAIAVAQSLIPGALSAVDKNSGRDLVNFAKSSCN